MLVGAENGEAAALELHAELAGIVMAKHVGFRAGGSVGEVAVAVVGVDIAVALEGHLAVGVECEHFIECLGRGVVEILGAVVIAVLAICHPGMGGDDAVFRCVERERGHILDWLWDVGLFGLGRSGYISLIVGGHEVELDAVALAAPPAQAEAGVGKLHDLVGGIDGQRVGDKAGEGAA